MRKTSVVSNAIALAEVGQGRTVTVLLTIVTPLDGETYDVVEGEFEPTANAIRAATDEIKLKNVRIESMSSHLIHGDFEVENALARPIQSA